MEPKQVEQIIPVLDMEELQKQVNKAAMTGAIKSIEEFYSGYNSPFRKALDEVLKKQEIGIGIDLPDIVALINDKLTREIDVIANSAIAKTFIPMVQDILTRGEKEMKFSDILSRFIKSVRAKEIEQCEVEVNKDTRYGWLNVELRSEDRNYSLTLHEIKEIKESQSKKYHILALPYGFEAEREKLTMRFADGTIEMPFTRNVLSDEFVSFIARLVINSSEITMDTTSFSEEMFIE